MSQVSGMLATAPGPPLLPATTDCWSPGEETSEKSVKMPVINVSIPRPTNRKLRKTRPNHSDAVPRKSQSQRPPAPTTPPSGSPARDRERFRPNSKDETPSPPQLARNDLVDHQSPLSSSSSVTCKHLRACSDISKEDNSLEQPRFPSARISGSLIRLSEDDFGRNCVCQSTCHAQIGPWTGDSKASSHESSGGTVRKQRKCHKKDFLVKLPQTFQDAGDSAGWHFRPLEDVGGYIQEYRRMFCVGRVCQKSCFMPALKFDLLIPDPNANRLKLQCLTMECNNNEVLVKYKQSVPELDAHKTLQQQSVHLPARIHGAENVSKPAVVRATSTYPSPCRTCSGPALHYATLVDQMALSKSLKHFLHFQGPSGLLPSLPNKHTNQINSVTNVRFPVLNSFQGDHSSQEVMSTGQQFTTVQNHSSQLPVTSGNQLGKKGFVINPLNPQNKLPIPSIIRSLNSIQTFLPSTTESLAPLTQVSCQVGQKRNTVTELLQRKPADIYTDICKERHSQPAKRRIPNVCMTKVLDINFTATPSLNKSKDISYSKKKNTATAAATSL